MHPLARLDRRYVWHPFTQMRDWMRREPIVIVDGRGSVLRDAHGREYLDGNATIWTNLHGHGHRGINMAIRRQLNRIAHSSALGFANEPASLLASRLVREANRGLPGHARLRATSGLAAKGRQPRLEKVFYSDNGSTALEVALKQAWEFGRRVRGLRRPRFLSLEGAYHGDTIGAVALGHIDLFHAAFRGLLFRTDSVMAPYCYRCPFNRAEPERADARHYRRCHWECVAKVESAFTQAAREKRPYTAWVVEPRMQGAAGMIPQPDGWLAQTAEIARGHGALLVADEVMTGFGRTGATEKHSLFACHHEGVQPDFLCLAKGLTGGYLPMAATLTTQQVFDAFLGEYSEFKTFFHGHSFTGNQVGAAAALASLATLETDAHRHHRRLLEDAFDQALANLWTSPAVGDVRRVGLVAGIELVRDWTTRASFDLRERVGIRVCEAMARRGVLTRPVGSVIVLMPPYSTTVRQLRTMVAVLAESIDEVLGVRRAVSAVGGPKPTPRPRRRPRRE
ncbi:MAG: adenosylmethionine--8-amino-7-oxononanoate transaminase [Verrucomicrobiales bacterium]|nr:adenosylmethionine--8-amino-7-oxononanoate transaminase [Verrucomicrobiales bacterium]